MEKLFTLEQQQRKFLLDLFHMAMKWWKKILRSCMKN